MTEIDPKMMIENCNLTYSLLGIETAIKIIQSIILTIAI